MRFVEEARGELAHAAAYYNALSPGVGDRFLFELNRLIEQIEVFPNAGLLVRPGLRQRLLPTFPYLVLYTFDGNDSAVLAVSHTSRREQYWMGRWEVREPVVAYFQLAA